MFADVEVMLRPFLLTRVSVPVVTKVPANRPPSFVRVWRTGGGSENRVLDRATVTVQAWGADCWGNAGKLRHALLNDSSGLKLVRRVNEITGPYSDPDPGSGVDRVSFNVEVYVREPR